MKGLILKIIVIILFVSVRSESQQIYFKKYDTETGLIQNTIRALTRDSLGRLWIGTAEGISVYDGKEMTNYGYNSGLTYTVINCFYPLNDSLMMIGGNDGGLMIFYHPAFDKDTLIASFRGKKFLINDRVNNILKDWDNNFWFCTDSGTTRWSFNSGKFSVNHFGESEGFPGTSVTGSVDYKKKLLWFGTEKGLIKWNGEKFILFKNSYLSNKDDFYKQILCSDDGKVFIGAVNYLSVFQNGKVKNLFKEFNLPKLTYAPIFAHNKSIWISSSKGLWKFENNKFSVIDRSNGLSEDYITSFLIDNENNHWIGTIYGLYKYSQDSFQLIKGSENIPTINSFALSADSILWAGGKSKIFILNNYKLFPAPIDNQIMKKTWMIKFINKNLWIIGLSGLIQKQNDKFITYDTPPLLSKYSFKVSKDKEGNAIVLSSNASLIKIVKGRIKNLIDEKSKLLLRGTNPTCLLNDKQGRIWIGTFASGLYLVHNGRIKKFTRADGLLDEQIRCLYEDDDGNIWIGTRYGGAFKFKDDKMRQYTIDEGLSSNWVKNILQDRIGNYWFGTGKGITRFDGKIWTRFDESYGLKAGEIQSSGMDKNGILYFGTNNGIYTFNPQYPLSYNLPKAYIKKFNFIDGTSVTKFRLKNFSPGDIFINSKIKKPQGDHIYDFTYEKNSFLIEFACSSLENEEKIAFKYKMEGVDKNWTSSGKRNYVLYHNLPAGRYNFLVYAIDGRGTKSKLPAKISFVIHPPFWETWWFISSAILLFTLFVSFISILIYRNKLKHLLMIERFRTKISADLHDDVGTSLSSIAILSEVIRKELGSGHVKSTEILKGIENTSRELIERLSDIVWTINPENDTLEDALERFKNYAVQLLNSENIQLKIIMPENTAGVNLTIGVRRNLLLIFKEAVTNAAKHSNANNIDIRIMFDRNKKLLIFKMTDDGKGFDMNEKVKGNGLNNMYRRAEEINGKITIKSSPGNGMSILLQLPVK
ncbi:sensor histidine kinase LiaS [bacterium BMS3Abin04]|nr:sensor histidine kinase LiaS [bacterium BMS3Abin04]